MSAEEAGRIARAAARVRRAGRMPMKVVVPTVAALGAGTAVAVGSIPGSGGTITGCYNTQPGDTSYSGTMVPYGTLRVIDPSLSTGTTEVPAEEYQCLSYEKTITWNQQGPQGPQGPQGIQGVAGSKGDRGSTGQPGQPGTINGDTALNFVATKSSRLLLDLGGSANAKGSKAIELESFGIGIEQPVVASSGQGVGKVTVQTFEFVMKRNAALDTLIVDEQQGRVIKTVDVHVEHSARTGKLSEVENFDLSNVLIKNITERGETDAVGGVFAKEVTTIGSGTNTVSTKLGPTSGGGWDLTQQKSP